MADQMEQPEQKTIIRVCKNCNQVKPIDMFSMNCNKQYVTRLHTCTDCHKRLRKEQNKKYYAERKKRASAPSTPKDSVKVVDVSDI
jgi:formate dehydrogenase maturation protein FdhE